MKSIKEKAIEVFPRHRNANTDYSNFNKRVGFNSGANYVLDAIQSCIDRHEDGCLALEAIILTIDELKR